MKKGSLSIVMLSILLVSIPALCNNHKSIQMSSRYKTMYWLGIGTSAAGLGAYIHRLARAGGRYRAPIALFFGGVLITETARILNQKK